jgi:hypothetical protein
VPTEKQHMGHVCWVISFLDEFTKEKTTGGSSAGKDIPMTEVQCRDTDMMLHVNV